MQETIKEIRADLRAGKEGREVFDKHRDVFGKFPTYMLAVASTSENMAVVYESTAKFMDRDLEFKRSLRKTLLMPFVTLGVIGLVVAYYVMVIFPETAGLFRKFGMDLPPMTAATLQLSDFLLAHYGKILTSIGIPLVAFIYWLRTPNGKYLKDKYILRVPMIGDTLHKTSIEIFARVFYSLYSDSGQNVEVINTAAEACRNTYMERQVKDVGLRLMLREGMGIVEAMEATGVFTRAAISRFRTGAETGKLREACLQLANYYETETSYRMERVVGAINMAVTMVIMVVMIGLTLVSSETAVM